MVRNKSLALYSTTYRVKTLTVRTFRLENINFYVTLNTENINIQE